MSENVMNEQIEEQIKEPTKEPRKNLANCKPSEFLRQTNKIRKSAARWLTDTDVLNIRKNLPTLKQITEDMTDEEKKAVFEENKALSAEQSKENLSKILDAILEEHPEETVELLALMCFIEPEEAENHPIGEYITVASELISNADVLNFFTSLIRLESAGILSIAKK